MNQHEYMKSVYESRLNRTCKDILIYFAWRKNWKNDSKVWGRPDNIGKAIEVSGRTVETWIPKLRMMGWLVDTGERRPGNGRPLIVYDLEVGTLTEITSVKPTTNDEDLTETISGKCQEDITDLNRNHCGQVGDLTEMSADLTETISVEQDINKIEEEQESTIPTPSGPVYSEEEFLVREDTPSSSNNTLGTSPNKEPAHSPNLGLQDAKLPKSNFIPNRFEVQKEFFTVASLMKLPEEVRTAAHALVIDADFQPEVSTPSIRINDAIAKTWREYDEGRTADE